MRADPGLTRKGKANRGPATKGEILMGLALTERKFPGDLLSVLRSALLIAKSPLSISVRGNAPAIHLASVH